MQLAKKQLVVIRLIYNRTDGRTTQMGNAVKDFKMVEF